MLDLIRDAPLGQAIRFLSRNQVLQYPEEKASFKLPEQYAARLDQPEKLDVRNGNSEQSSINIVSGFVERTGQNDSGVLAQHGDDVENLRRIETAISIHTAPYSNDRVQAERHMAAQRTTSIPVQPKKTIDGIVLVDWYTTDDPANPQNWSRSRKALVLVVLCYYTATVYAAGPIYAAAEEGIQREFGVSAVASTLGLGLYILAYGVGDLLFAPLSEIPVIGRNPVYYLTFIIYWVLSFPTATVKSFSGLLALRFWLGFFGSPALANGGATIGDMFALIYIPVGLSMWVLSAWIGPVFGPLIGGFAAQAKGWRWPMWETVWMASPGVIFLLVLIPETSPSNILLGRARRLRKLTGDARLQAQGEIDQRHLKFSDIFFTTLIKPMEIMMKDPAVFFVNVYSGYFYGVFYTFFEVLPLVFRGSYGFNLGQTGLTFLACLIGVTIAAGAYFAYLYLYMIPDNIKHGLREQEYRLVPAIVGSILLPIGLFIFAWTANSTIHWAVPLTGVAIFVVGNFWIMQSLFIYLPLSYPQHIASLFAGNSVWRSGVAGGAVVFARPLFIDLGVDKGVTLLAGLGVGGVFGILAIYVYGKKLRARSKFAQS
jgi:DHA1 family multidrug resistance protein-like MFS transporter